MKPLIVTSGEPAGIGPDICLSLVNSPFPLVVLGDKEMLAERADMLGLNIRFEDFYPGKLQNKKNHLTVLSVPCAVKVRPGVLDVNNAKYVVDLLSLAITHCLKGDFSGLITAPVHKAILNEAGFNFCGHTEFLAKSCGCENTVMMFYSKRMKLALITTHLPLKDVPKAITEEQILKVIRILHKSLQDDFGITNPTIYVAGLNPHAGENGYLGREEIEIIEPALDKLKHQKIQVEGPYPADTLFLPDNLKRSDACVAMYHDQALPVLKFSDFECAVNITLGLPIVRTSVDHGTALQLAGTGKAKSKSLHQALTLASQMAARRNPQQA